MEKPYLAIVPALHIEDVWMKALPHILNGKEHWQDFFTVQQIKRNLVLGRQQLWIMIEKPEVLGVVLTQLDDFPERRVLRILFLGGKGFKREMMQTMRQIELWAMQHGASFVDILGRDAWKPLVERLGYKSPGRVYRKELVK